MRRSSLIVWAASIVVVASIGPPTPAGAHLRAVGGSLLDLLVRSDGVIVVEVLAATQDAPKSHTRVRTRKVLGGRTAPEQFDLQNALSPMRYAAGQTAIVAVQHTGDLWTATQLAGEGLVLGAEGLDPATAQYVAGLWKATHAADPDGDLGLLLRQGLRLPHQKLRLLAALDIAEISHHQPGLSEAARGALLEDLADPDLDPAARLALSRALGAPR